MPMEIEIVYILVIVSMGYFGITFDYIMRRDFDISFINPVRNYNKWTSLNYLGIGVITILINIIWLPYAVIYWPCMLIGKLFTVGRK